MIGHGMRVLLAGDSTVAACPPEESPMSGWGAALGDLLGPGVHNFARGGATTESFIAEGLWADLLAACQPGDVAVIQFGHNDQKRPALLAAEGGYRARLDGFLTDLRARDVTPVLCTSVERRLFDGDRLRPSHGGYPRAVRRLAAERQVALIDLTVFTSWLYADLGVAGSAGLFTTRDNTHFHDHGARTVAAFVAESLAAILGRDGDMAPLGRAGTLP